MYKNILNKEESNHFHSQHMKFTYTMDNKTKTTTSKSSKQDEKTNF